jgi:hypothetical protein
MKSPGGAQQDMQKSDAGNSADTGRSMNLLLRLQRSWQALPKAVCLAALVISLLLLISIYYVLVWQSVDDFVRAMDHHDRLFQDFLGHYYPMGKTLLETPVPVPGFFYSAFSALLLVPFGALATAPATWSWGALQALSILSLCFFPFLRLLHLTTPGIVLSVGVWLTAFPLLHNFKWGQVSALLTACVLAAFHAYAAKQRIVAGGLLAVATAIKYYPAVFLVYFVLKRDFRVCSSFALALILFYILLPVAVLGLQPWIKFEQARYAAVAGASWISRDVNSQYFAHVVPRWNKLLLRASGIRISVPCIAVVGYVIFLGNLALVWCMQRRQRRDEYSLALVLLFLSLPFVVKTSWPHYFCYLPFCQTAIFSRLVSEWSPDADWGKVLLLSLLFLSIACSSVFVFNLFPNWQVYNAYGMLFLANILLLLCMYIIIWNTVLRTNK